MGKTIIFKILIKIYITNKWETVVDQIKNQDISRQKGNS